MPSTEWLSYAGVELVNTARTRQYSTVQIQTGSPHLAAALGDQPYTDPVSDNAPWYDSNAPESKDFYGFVGLDITGADATRETQWTELIGDGGVPGATRRTSRELEVRALAVAATDQALGYGLSWLSAALDGSPCAAGCTGDTLCVFAETPAPPPPMASGCDPDGFDTGGGQSTIWNALTAGDQLQRELFDVTCIGGPTVTGRRRLSGGWVAEVSFTLKAGVPWWYRLPVHVVDLDLSNLPDDAYQDMIPTYNPITVLDNCEEQPPTCLDDNPYDVLPEPVPQVPPTFVDPAYPTSTFSAARIIYTVPPSSNPGWLEKVPVVTIRSGSLPAHRLTIRWYDNPLGRTCGPNLNPCEACSEITLPWLPRSSTLVLDSRTGSATINCPGSPVQLEAEHELYGPRGGLFTWPAFPCQSSMCIEILADADAVAQDMTVQIDMVAREDVA